ncbi:MAG TPA: DUF547 domain-containing protein [Thermoanaerobaculia bacterium]|nr:DUF547 domain-containing protein [Thermoanaerobaculia bacterium]
MTRLRTALLLSLMLLAPACGDAAPPPAPAAPGADGGVDWTPWARLLERHVRPGSKGGVELTRVDYSALAGDGAELRATLSALAAAEPAAMSRDQRLALWINAYNALALEVVRQSWPVDSIRDAGGVLFAKVWDKEVAAVAGAPRSLDEIEHRILRPMAEPRIHFAIVCASVSCPDLRREPFRASRLDGQLDAQTRAFLANSAKGMRLDRQRRVVHLSKIFDWFGEDFAAAGGVLAFVARHAPAADAAWLRQQGENVRVEYLHYDWSLNGE